MFKKVFDDAKKVFRHPSRGVAKHFFGKNDERGDRWKMWSQKKGLTILEIDSESWRESVKGVKTPKKGGVWAC